MQAKQREHLRNTLKEPHLCILGALNIAGTKINTADEEEKTPVIVATTFFNALGKLTLFLLVPERKESSHLKCHAS